MRVSDNAARIAKVNIEQATISGRARRACVVLFVAALFLIGLGLYQAPSTSVHAAPTSPTAAPGQPTATKFGKLATVLPEPTGTASPDGTFAGWERVALHDVAEVVGWPTTVAYDSSGRLRVQNFIDSDHWTAAHIRAFDYAAAARASFTAEQDDSRLAGFTVTPGEFYSYPSYTAYITDHSGAVVERRLRWLAPPWIVGVDVRGDAVPAEAPGSVADILVSIAVWRGLPAPPSGQAPTPNPTWSLPPLNSPTVTPCTADFADVDSSYWASGYIYRLACGGIVSGYSDGTFRPEYPTTRAQLAKMLVLSQSWTLVNPRTPSFTDVGLSHPFNRYIETAASHGVISGYGDGTFRPDAHVTRAQVAKMFVRSQDWAYDPATVQPLRDVSEDFWAYTYIQAALQHGLFTGYGDQMFRPSMLATRAQLSKLLILTSPQ